MNSPLGSGFLHLALVSVFVLSACGGSGGGGGTSVADQEESWSLTNESTSSLLDGTDSFSQLSDKYAAAASKYPGNKVAPMMKSFVDLLAWVKESLNDPSDANESLKSMLARAGITVVTANRSFWDYEFSDTTNGGKNLPADLIKTDEILALLNDRIRPRLEGIVSVLAGMPSNFSYMFKPKAGDPTEYEMDIGDVALVRSSLRFGLAWLAIINGYDFASYDLKELQLPDPLANWDSLYSNLGKVASVAEQRRARNLIRDAFNDYVVAAARIRGETQDQADRGLVTLGGSTFASASERDMFMSREARFRAEGQRAVNAMYSNSGYSVDTDLDGEPIPAADVVTVNLYKLTEGVNLRDVFLGVIPDHIRGGHTFGVRGVGQITPAMYTLGGVFVDRGGNSSGPGDVQERGVVGVLVEDVPVHTKTFDGNFGDWNSTNSVLVAAEPKAANPGVGNVWAARDSNYLYLRIDEDLRDLLTGGWWDYYALDVDVGLPYWSGPYAYIHHYGGSSYNSHGGEMLITSAGHEIRIPLTPFASYTHVSLEIAVHASGRSSSRERIHIEIRK